LKLNQSPLDTSTGLDLFVSKRREVITEVCQELLPLKLKRTHHKDWFDINNVEVIALLSERNKARMAYLKEPSLQKKVYIRNYVSFSKLA